MQNRDEVEARHWQIIRRIEDADYARGVLTAMTTPAPSTDYHEWVRKAAAILARALGPVVADMATAKGFDRYRTRNSGDRRLSTLANTSDSSEVLTAMLDYWDEVFAPHFGRPVHFRVRQTAHNVISIRDYYVGDHDGAECDYEPYDALGEIARLLHRFSVADAVREVNELRQKLGSLMYGQQADTPQPAADSSDNVTLTEDALKMLLEMLIAGTVSQEVARQLHSEPGYAGSRQPYGGPPATPGPASALPPTVPPVSASSDADVVPTPIAPSPVDVDAPVSAENAILAGDALNNGNIAMLWGHIDQAIGYFSRAIELNPQFAVAYNDRGVAYIMQGEYDRAIADYDAAIG